MFEFEVSDGLKRLLNPYNKVHVEGVLKKACNELGRQITVKIKEDGFAPRDTSKLARSHHVLSDDRETVIRSDRVASNGVPLWIYIVGGHRVLTTEKSRKWWFWYLKNVLGGNYTRKTSGKRGYVPPNRYHERAVNALNFTGMASRIVNELLR